MLVIRLVGRPDIERDGVVVVPPRGHKTRTVLAYLVLAERPVARARLGDLVFGDADDALETLRWTPAQLRPRSALLTRCARIRSSWAAAGPRRSGARARVRRSRSGLARGELLKGVDPGAGTVFDAWLLVERRRLAGECEAMLRDAALRALASGAALDASALASRALALNEFDETTHGCWFGAWRGRARWARLDITPTPVRCDSAGSWAVRPIRGCGARPTTMARTTRRPVSDRAAAIGQLQAGRAAMAGGCRRAGYRVSAAGVRGGTRWR
jgi:hypothetical protein